MTIEQVVTLIGIALGSGGIGAAIVSAIASRKKVAADANSSAFEALSHTAQTLAEVSEKRIASLCERAEKMEQRVEALEAQVRELRGELMERDSMIDGLQRENVALAEQVSALEAENKCKERKIESLQKRVKELETRLNALNGAGDGRLADSPDRA
jgi:chromosome segregation ATPase